MIIKPATMDNAGFTYAHALWNLSDMPIDENLCPLAFAMVDGERQLLRFEADTQEEAIHRAFDELCEIPKSTAWALAREGTIRGDSEPTDVLILDVWEHGCDAQVTILQPYQPFASGEFFLLDMPVLLVDGEMLAEEDSGEYFALLRQGAKTHQKAADFWQQWGGW